MGELPFGGSWSQTGVMPFVKSISLGAVLCAAFFSVENICAQKLTPHPIRLADGKALTLSLPANFTINVAAQGLRRVRFMTKSPDNRIFATDMYNRADNTLGKVYVLDGWNEKTGTFAKVTPYLEHLHNPNNVAFYTEPSQGGKAGQSWLYLALTDKLIRYKYNAGDNAP